MVQSFLLDPLDARGALLGPANPGVSQHAVHLPTGAVQVVEPEVPLAVLPAGALMTSATGLLRLALPHCGGELPGVRSVLEITWCSGWLARSVTVIRRRKAGVGCVATNFMTIIAFCVVSTGKSVVCSMPGVGWWPSVPDREAAARSPLFLSGHYIALLGFPSARSLIVVKQGGRGSRCPFPGLSSWFFRDDGRFLR